MDFMTAVRTCLTEKYATFSGRARRSGYWWFILFVIVAALIWWVLQLIVSLALLIPGIAAGFRRLHDTGRPGWYIFIPVALSFIGGILNVAVIGAAAYGGGGGGGLILVGIFSLIQLAVGILFIVWLASPGKPETNQYGPPPA